MGNYHARCGAGEKPEVVTLEAYLSLFALPDDFCSLLSTMRSREISSVIIIQNFAQLKALFKDTWETIPGNCDTFIYLGGNEQSTHKYVSELLGKGTIDKKSSGETKGRQGSSSRNYDVLGRELFTPDEIRKLDNKKCIVFIRGFNPVMDGKYIPFKNPRFKLTEDGGAAPYVHEVKYTRTIGPPVTILSDKSLEYYKRRKEEGDNVFIDDITLEALMELGQPEYNQKLMEHEEKIQKERRNEEVSMELMYSEEDISDEEDSDSSDNIVGSSKKAGKKNNPTPEFEGADSIFNRSVNWQFSKEQVAEIKIARKAGIPESKILEYFYPSTSVEEMVRIREDYTAGSK